MGEHAGKTEASRRSR